MIYLYRKYKQKREQSNARQGTIGESTRNESVSSEKPAENFIDQDIGSADAGDVEADQHNASKRDQRTPEQKHAARKYRWKLIVCLLPPYFLATVDLTIVASALPYIASYFDKLNQLNWIVTAYTLTSTAFIPVFGQFADILGRHTTLQLSMAFMIVGSTLCAAAQTWGMLLLGRALQGVSSSGLMNIIRIVLAEGVSLEEQSKNTTIFFLIAGASYSIGPVVGGYLTEADWRYCFVLSIPIAVIASVLLFFVLRKELVQGTRKQLTATGEKKTLAQNLATIDYGGFVLFIFGVGLTILATSWGGTTYSWNSTEVLVPLVLGPILLVLFFVYEYLLEPGRMVNRRFSSTVPMIPWKLFSKLDTLSLAIINFSAGAAIYSAFYFISLYFTIAQGFSAGRAGVQLLYYIPGLGVGAWSAMFACNVWPAQTFWPLLLGSSLEAVGMGLITWGVTTPHTAIVNGMMALAGVGTGLRGMPATLHGVGIWPKRIAQVVSLMDFAFPFGGTIALTIMGATFNNEFAKSTASLLASSSGPTGLPEVNPRSKGTIHAIERLPPAIKAKVRDAAGTAVMWAFVAILPIMAISVFASMWLGNVWIKRKSEKQESDNPNESIVMHQPYLLALMNGTVNSKKVSNHADMDEPWQQSDTRVEKTGG